MQTRGQIALRDFFDGSTNDTIRTTANNCTPSAAGRLHEQARDREILTAMRSTPSLRWTGNQDALSTDELFRCD